MNTVYFSKANLVSGLKPATRFATLATLLMAVFLLTACGGGGSGGGGGGSGPAGVTTDPVGDVNRFPDDGRVSWTLDITRQNIASPTSSWNVTATTTSEACSIIAPSVRTLSYGTNNQTTAIFEITFTGTTTVGGSCNVNFAINEDEQTRNLRRTVTFSAERAPTLVAELVDNGIDVNSIESVRVNVIATKSDGSNAPDITFPMTIMSSPASTCTATIDGSTARQYSTAGTSSVSVIYNVSPLNREAAATCGSFNFTATEGSTTGTRSFTSGINFVIVDSDDDGIDDPVDNCPLIVNLNQEDSDMDNVGDPCDVDVDGDGLIEIRTVAELNMMRNNLAGTGFDADNSDNNAAGGDSNGCGNGGSITACNGYEQMADFDLNDLPKDAATGSNWEPVGNCDRGDAGVCATDDPYFTGTFSGNNFTISNMLINVTTDSTGVGFFGAVSPTAQILNVHIRGGNITAEAGVTSRFVGGLVGVIFSNGATISNSLVTLDTISGTTNVGGLIGRFNGEDVRISSSVVTVGSISGTDDAIGGLVGFGLVGTISSSVATVGSISGGSDVGGLVGIGTGATIRFSLAVTNNITGSDVGGLVGAGVPTSVDDSYWDDRVVGSDGVTKLANNNKGTIQTTVALQLQTIFIGANNIYAKWNNAYCNPNTGEYSATAPSPIGDFIRVWDLGDTDEYPAITCNPTFSPAQQRAATARVQNDQSPIGE